MTRRAARTLFAIGLACVAGSLVDAQTTSPEPTVRRTEAVPAEALEFTPQQIAALNALDAAITRYEADLARMPDAGQRARSDALLDVFKERRATMRRQRFDQVKYDELRFDLNVEYQRLGQFLAAPRTPAGSAAPARPAKIEIADLKLVLMPIAAGTFVMGRAVGTAGSSPDESPETRVFFSKPFWLGATEITVGQWKQFVSATGHRTDAEQDAGLFVSNGSGKPGIDGWEKRAGLSWRNPGREQTDEHPVVGVSWSDAQSFCAWLTQREKAAGRLPANHVYSLPTEAQWEYACRAGNRGPDPENLDDWAWHAGNSGKVPHPVGTKRPNLWGLYDMQGNVWEWCLDWRGPYPGGSVTDPHGPSEGMLRECRGGSARSPAGHGISSTNRWSTPGLHQRDDLGFRVALTSAR
jgi:formylglycine-generating enzyme required for sulfatase activity